jgi:hypothetical protein
LLDGCVYFASKEIFIRAKEIGEFESEIELVLKHLIASFEKALKILAMVKLITGGLVGYPQGGKDPLAHPSILAVRGRQVGASRRMGP